MNLSYNESETEHCDDDDDNRKLTKEKYLNKRNGHLQQVYSVQ